MTEDSSFPHYPDGIYNRDCGKAAEILRNAHSIATSLLAVHEALSNPTIPSELRQDVLRAILVFASSGLDSMVKQLVKDALPKVIDHHERAQDNLRDFVDRRLRSRERNDVASYAYIVNALVRQDPRRHLIRELVTEITSHSLQSVEEILRTGSYFDIPSEDIIPKGEVDIAKRIFRARNQIVHEMDVDVGQEDGHRRPREEEDMKSKTTTLFAVSLRFLEQVNARLPADTPMAPTT